MVISTQLSSDRDGCRSQSWVCVRKSPALLPGQPGVSSHRTQPFCSGKPAGRTSNVNTQRSQSLLSGAQRELSYCAWQSNRTFLLFSPVVKEDRKWGDWSWEGNWRWCRRRLAAGTLTLSKSEPNFCSPNIVDQVARWTPTSYTESAAVCLQAQCTQEGVTWNPGCTLVKKQDCVTSLVVQWLSPCSQCRGPGFEPWSGNWIPHAAS